MLVSAIRPNAASSRPPPEGWRRLLAIVTDGLRTRRDEPDELGHEPLAPEQTQLPMRAWRPGPR